MTRLLFSTPSYGSLGDAVCRAAGGERGRVSVRGFPDGERHLLVETPVADREVVLLGGTVSDGDTLALYDIASGLAEQGARTLTLVIPYFGYSTMERAGRPGEVVTAKSRARLLSAVPRAKSGNRVVLFDVHTEGLPYYFEGGVYAAAVSADPVILAAARGVGASDFVLASADAGRAKRVQALANQLGVDAGFVFKRRLGPERTELVAMAADVAGRPVVLYDDMIRTGSSLIGAARAYRDAGAEAVTAVATHGVFPGDALERLRQSGLFQGVVCTDSHPRAGEVADGTFLRVQSIASLLAAALS